MTTTLPRPSIGAPAAYRFPVARRFQLDNGIAVLAYDLPGQLVVSATLLLDAPETAEPRDLEGVATLALRCADEGTVPHPGAAFTEAVEDQGATLGGAAHLWSTQLAVEAPATRLDAALALLAEAVAQPAYADEDVARHVALRLTEIEHMLADPKSSSVIALRAAVTSADSRMHRPGAGRPDTVASLSAADLHAFHDRWWTPRGATLIVAGQLPDGVDAMLQRDFGTWHPAVGPEGPDLPTTAEAEPAPGVVWVIDHPDAVQAAIAIGTLTPPRADPAWSLTQVGTAALGGSFGSRLNTVLREQRGFTYGASCGLSASRDCSLFGVHTNCRTEVAAQAVTTALELLDLDARPLTPDEVRSAVDYLVGVAPLRYDTADAIAAQAAALVEAGMPTTWIDEHHDRMRSATAASATAALAPWIAPQRLHTVIAGRADELVPALGEAGLDPRVVDVAGQPRG